MRATVLEEPEWSVNGRIANRSGTGLLLVLEEPVPIDAAVRIDLDDAIFLGEVVYCQKDENGYRSGLRLQHALYGVPGILGLMQGIFGSEETTLNQTGTVDGAARPADFSNQQPR